jgi:hypothetical protein
MKKEGSERDRAEEEEDRLLSNSGQGRDAKSRCARFNQAVKGLPPLHPEP